MDQILYYHRGTKHSSIRQKKIKNIKSMYVTDCSVFSNSNSEVRQKQMYEEFPEAKKKTNVKACVTDSALVSNFESTLGHRQGIFQSLNG